jgi:hypothetical protein
VNPKDANLTLNSVGNVSILDDQGVATTQTLTIDTRSQILTGKIGYALTSLSGRPQSVILNADGGIVSFSTGYADSINATSSDGSITLNVSAPGQLRITTGTVGTPRLPDLQHQSEQQLVRRLHRTGRRVERRWKRQSVHREGRHARCDREKL